MNRFDRCAQRGEIVRKDYHSADMVKWLSSEVSNLMSWVRLPLSAPQLTKPMSELRTALTMQTLKASKGLFLVSLMLLASLSGCFGEEGAEDQPIVSFELHLRDVRI